MSAPSLNAGEQAGTQIGRYRLLEKIGEGGMGTVWMAEQKEPVKRRVALKIVKLGMDTKQVIARFEAERQALALMDHPHIAKVLDAGATEAGRPYFVMEYIKGIPILEYCDREKVDTKARLNLFTSVCHAIQHAHQKGIIHRDIKPSNVLVTLHDGVPVPKVIDFGIAKATNAELTTKTLFTEHKQMLGTPAYMSPEQAEMSGLDIDTRSDIYSLGVLLYELLTGTTPFDTKELLAKGFAEMMRTIREVEPHKPSTRISTLGDTASRTAQLRHVDVKQLGTLLRGDLDWIVMKCLEKDRSRRYETANGLAADIKRHLHDEPVTAGPPSASYQLRKFVRRNRAQVLAGGAVAAFLVLGVIGTTGGMLWASREAERAEGEKTKATLAAESEAKAKTEAQANEKTAVAEAKAATTAQEQEAKSRKRAESISAFVTEALKSSDPENQGGHQDTTILQAMDHAIADLDSGRFRDDPAIEAGMKGMIGRILHNNGRPQEALVLLTSSLETERRLAGGYSENLSIALNNLALVLKDLGHTEEARRLFEQALEMAKRLFPGDHPAVALCLNNFALAMAPQEAEPLLRQALEMNRRLFPGDSPAVALGLTSLAGVVQALGRTAEAEPLFAQALAMRRRVHQGDHPFLAKDLDNLGKTKVTLHHAAEGVELLAQALAMRRRLFQAPHPDLEKGLSNLASVLRGLGRWAEAEPLTAEALEMRRRLSPGDDSRVAELLSKLAMVRRELGRAAEAERLYAEALEMLQRVHRGDHSDVADTLAHLGSVLERQGRSAEASALLVQALEMRRRLHRGDHLDIATSLTELGHALLAQGLGVDAASHLVEALEMYRRLAPRDRPRTAIDLDNLGKDLVRAGRPADGEALLAQSVAMRERLYAGDHPDLATGLHNLAGVQQTRRRFTEAETNQRRSLEMRQRLGRGDDAGTAAALQQLAVILRDAGRHAEAEPLQLQALDMFQRLFPGDGPDVALALYGLGTIREVAGRVAEAVPPYEAALQMQRRRLPASHADVLASIVTLARAYYGVGSFEKAIPLYEEASKAYEATLGRQHQLTLLTIGNLGANYRVSGRVAEAIPLLEEAWRKSKGQLGFVGGHLLDAYVHAGDASKLVVMVDEWVAASRAVNTKDSVGLARDLSTGAMKLLDVKAWVAAEPLVREALAICEKVQPDAWLTFISRSLLGGALLGQEKHAEAEPLLLAGYRGMKQREATVGPNGKVRMREAILRLVQLYEATGNAAEAATWREELEAAQKAQSRPTSDGGQR